MAAALATSSTGEQMAYADVTYVISGTVTDAGTGLPIAGATVISDQVDRATTDESGRYVLRVMPSPLAHSLSVSADLYYTPPRPTEVLVTDRDVSGVDVALKRDRATIRPPALRVWVDVRAEPGQTVTVELGDYVTAGSYPIQFLEFGIPDYGATPSGARYVLDHQASLRVGAISITGSTLTFTASSTRSGTEEVYVMALDPSNFGGATMVTVTVQPTRACVSAKSTLAKAKKAGASPGTIRRAKAAVAAACRA